VVLLEIPSRNELRVKNLFNVADCKMHWQKCGDYLCVKVRPQRTSRIFIQWVWIHIILFMSIFGRIELENVTGSEAKI
jgi:hypothetical protein